MCRLRLPLDLSPAFDQWFGLIPWRYSAHRVGHVVIETDVGQGVDAMIARMTMADNTAMAGGETAEAPKLIWAQCRSFSTFPCGARIGMTSSDPFCFPDIVFRAVVVAGCEATALLFVPVHSDCFIRCDLRAIVPFAWTLLPANRRSTV